MLALPTAILAADVRGGDTVAIKTEEKIVNDVYVAGSNIASLGDIVGDFVAAGGNLFISGNVSQDVMAAGGTVTIGAIIGDDLRAAGGNVTVSGPVTGDALLAGGTIHVISTADIGGDARLAGGEVTLDAPVKGTLTVDGGNVVINGMVTGNTQINAESITIGSSAVIAGNLTYSSTSPIIISQGAVIKGTTTQNPVSRTHNRAGNVVASLSLLTLMKLLAFAVTAIVLVSFMPKKSLEIVETTQKNFWQSAGRGFLVAVVTPIVVAILMVTMIGMPIAVILLLTYILMMMFANLFAAVFLGSVVIQKLRKDKKVAISWRTAFIGMVLLFILALIPVIGWIAYCIVVCAALGTLSNVWHKKLVQYA